MEKIVYENISTDIFPGFYESILFNSDTEHLANEVFEDEKDREIVNFKEFTEDVAKGCAEALKDNLYQDDEIIIDMSYHSLFSPNSYNYGTDKLRLNVEFNLELLKEFCFIKHEKDFEKFLKMNFTSCDGFVSFIENNLKDFKQKVEEKHTNHLEVMIEYYLLENVNIENYLSTCHDIAQEKVFEYLK